MVPQDFSGKDWLVGLGKLGKDFNELSHEYVEIGFHSFRHFMRESLPKGEHSTA
jgi:hypothetical protein